MTNETQSNLVTTRLPEDVLIILPVRNTVLFPGMVFPLTIGRGPSIAAAEEAARSERPIGIIQQRDPSVDVPGPDDLHKIGTIATVLRYVNSAEGTHHIICQGQQRFAVLDYIEGHPFLLARVQELRTPETDNPEIEARLLHLKRQATEALALLPQAPAELNAAVEATRSPSVLADMIAGFMDISPAEKQEILETLDVRARLDKVARLLAHRITVLKLTQEIGEQTKESMDQRQREFLLREQMKTIQKELGETDSKSTEMDELTKAIADAKMPEEVEKQATKELRRLESMPDSSMEHSMVRTYLD